MNDVLFADPARLRTSIAPAEEPYAWWASLNHGGLLIAPSKLAERFPARVEPLPAAMSERLRRDLTRLQEGGDERLAAFLDTVLEELLGLNKARFKKGSEVDKAWSQPAVTGEIIRPRRVWLGPNGAVLPVFVDTTAGSASAEASALSRASSNGSAASGRIQGSRSSASPRPGSRCSPTRASSGSSTRAPITTRSASGIRRSGFPAAPRARRSRRSAPCSRPSR